MIKIEALNIYQWRNLVEDVMDEKNISKEEAIQFIKDKYGEQVPENLKMDMINSTNVLDSQEDQLLYLPETDLQGLSDNTTAKLIAKQIVNKWLCQALDKNDSKAVREACIVLKAMNRRAYEFGGKNPFASDNPVPYMTDFKSRWFFDGVNKDELNEDCKYIIKTFNLDDDIELEEADNGCILTTPYDSDLVEHLKTLGYDVKPYSKSI